jgi:glutamate N-acetyltransferase / amino-acid N-acetyltransferase
MLAGLPAAVAALQPGSVLPAASGIMTTDMYPKVRSAAVAGTAGGTVVGIAKGAGMIEPNLATMLVYLLTDVDVPRAQLRALLPAAVHTSFNALSIDSDQSTSDSVVLLSSNAVPLGPGGLGAFGDALRSVCAALAEDVVRNGEGVQHVMRVTVAGAPSEAMARAVGKSVVNSPLFKCAVAGNDPNVGRLVAAIGKCVGNTPEFRGTDLSRTVLRMGGITIYANGQFALAPETERKLVAHLKGAQLWGESGVVGRGGPALLLLLPPCLHGCAHPSLLASAPLLARRVAPGGAAGGDGVPRVGVPRRGRPLRNARLVPAARAQR